jgi:hypothetical protein
MPVPDTSNPEQGRAAPMAAERRVAARAVAEASTFCCLFAGTGAHLWPGQVRDLSASDINVLLPYPLLPGRALSAHLGNAARHFAVLTSLHVIHATPAPAGWVVGCAFDRPLDQAEIAALR